MYVDIIISQGLHNHFMMHDEILADIVQRLYTIYCKSNYIFMRKYDVCCVVIDLFVRFHWQVWDHSMHNDAHLLRF